MKKGAFKFVFFLVLVAILTSISVSLIVEKKINWIIVLAMGFGTFCGTIIWLRYVFKK